MAHPCLPGRLRQQLLGGAGRIEDQAGLVALQNQHSPLPRIEAGQVRIGDGAVQDRVVQERQATLQIVERLSTTPLGCQELRGRLHKIEERGLQRQAGRSEKRLKEGTSACPGRCKERTIP